MQDATTDDELENLTFEQALERLEQTVRAVEAGDLPLSEITALYENGVRLAKRCSILLSQSELEIQRIQTEYAAEPPAEPPPAEAPPEDVDDLPW